MTATYQGIMLGFAGSRASGLAHLVLGRVENGRDLAEEMIPCENGPTARALVEAFDIAGPGHSIDNGDSGPQNQLHG